MARSHFRLAATARLQRRDEDAQATAVSMQILRHEAEDTQGMLKMGQDLYRSVSMPSQQTATRA